MSLSRIGKTFLFLSCSASSPSSPGADVLDICAKAISISFVVGVLSIARKCGMGFGLKVKSASVVRGMLL